VTAPLRTLTCALCGDAFETTWSDQDANAEAEAFWGVKDAVGRPDWRVICDPCWQRIQPAPFTPTPPTTDN
jgi:hypothetical protein